MSAIAVVGSVAFDTIETPSGRATEILGGSATHFAVAARYFAPVHLIAVVGDDFPATPEAAQRWATALSTIRGVALLRLLGHPPAAVERQWAATRRHLLALLS